MDGSKINDKEVTQEELLALGYRKYRGNEMDIYYSKDICQHVGNCVRGNPEVFNIKRKPWILPDNGKVIGNIRVINTCPTGALKYLIKEYSGE